MTTTNSPQFTEQEIIETKIEFLNGNSNDDLSDEMKRQVDSDTSLKSEIRFIESIWQKPELDQTQSPSPQMRANFYQMLSQAQTAQTQPVEQASVNIATAEVSDSGSWSLTGALQKLGWFQPAFQFALVLGVFSIGWFMAPSAPPQGNINTAALEEQVDTLNVMVALSMLKNDSAAERLAGIDYSKNVGLKDQQLTSTLFSLLNNDRSSAVRISAVESLTNSESLSGIRVSLVESLSKQSNVIVQIALVNALHRAGAFTKDEIELILSNPELDSEVVKLIQHQYQKKSKPELRT